MNTPPVTPTVGIIDTLKNKAESFKHMVSWDQAIHYSLLCVGGLLLGFIMRRFGSQLTYALIGSLIVISIASYMQLVVIDWSMINSLGIFPASTIEGVVNVYIILLKKYAVEVIATTIGFVIGYKISS